MANRISLEGSARYKRGECARELALPKITEQSKPTEVSISESSSAGSSAKRGLRTSEDGSKIRRNKKVVAPTVQELTLGVDFSRTEDNSGQKAGSRNLESSLKSRLGLSNKKRRPLTATWPQENSKLLNISNLGAYNHRDTVPKQGIYPKSYPTEDALPSLEAKKTAGLTAKSCDRDIASLCVGITETWKASSLQPQDTKGSQTFHNSRTSSLKIRQRVADKASMHFPSLLPPQGIIGFATGNASSRTISRMGRNSFDQFLKNSPSVFPEIKPKLASEKVIRERDAVQVCLSPLSNHSDQLLHLKGFVRNPVSPAHHHKLEKFADGKSLQLGNVQTISSQPAPGTRQSLKTPYSLQLHHNGDVPLPPPAPTNPFNDAYRIFAYVAL